MAAWFRLAAPIALAIAAAGPGAAQPGGSGQPALEPAQIVSAAQDCLDSYKGYAVDPRQLKKRGWAKARLAGMGGLEAVMTGFVRNDGAIMLVMRSTCMVKARLVPPASADGLAAAMSERWAAQPVAGADGMLAWRLPERRIELSPGPADGTNVSVTISSVLAGIE
jgi:hypothetical protein